MIFKWKFLFCFCCWSFSSFYLSSCSFFILNCICWAFFFILKIKIFIEMLSKINKKKNSVNFIILGLNFITFETDIFLLSIIISLNQSLLQLSFMFLFTVNKNFFLLQFQSWRSFIYYLWLISTDLLLLQLFKYLSLKCF